MFGFPLETLMGCIKVLSFKKTMRGNEVKVIQFTSEELIVLEQALDFFQQFLCKEPKLENATTFTGDIPDSIKVLVVEDILEKTEATFDYYMEKNKFVDCGENKYAYLRRTNYEHIDSIDSNS